MIFPIVAICVPAILAVAVASWGRRQIFFYSFILLTFTATPAWFPQTIPLGTSSVFIYELPLLLFILCSLFRRGTLLPAILGLIAVNWLLLTLFGLVSNASFVRVTTDVRPLLQLLLAAVATVLFIRQFRVGALPQIISASLWISAALTIASSTVNLALAGVSETVPGQTADSVERIRSAASFPAILVLCVIVPLIILGKIPLFRSMMLFVIPSTIITLIAFSRNNLVGLVVALLWTAVCFRRELAGVRTLASASKFAALVVVIGLCAIAFDPTWVSAQVGAFSDRVIGGINSSAASSDPSLLYRSYEIHNILPMISRRPFLGFGFGATYQPPIYGLGSFFSTQGPQYCHQFFLWLALKGGWISVVIFLLAFIPGFAKAFRIPSAVLVGVSSGCIAMLAISFFAPLAIGYPTAALMGCFIGALLAVSPSVSRARSELTLVRAEPQGH